MSTVNQMMEGSHSYVDSGKFFETRLMKNYQSICIYPQQENRAFRNTLGLVVTDT